MIIRRSRAPQQGTRGKSHSRERGRLRSSRHLTMRCELQRRVKDKVHKSFLSFFLLATSSPSLPSLITVPHHHRTCIPLIADNSTTHSTIKPSHLHDSQWQPKYKNAVSPSARSTRL